MDMPTGSHKPLRKRKKTKRNHRPERLCITEKLESSRIKQVLARRKTALQMTETLARGLPTQLQTLRSSSFQPEIQLMESHTLSPFVIHLADLVPSPQEFLDLQEQPSTFVNFLETAPLLPSVLPEWTWEPAPLSDVTLESEDLAMQLKEATNEQIPWWHLIALPSFSFLRKKAEVQKILPQEKSIVLPENIFAYFDFPETEGEEEADVVDFEDLTNSACEQMPITPAQAFRFPSFHFPQISFPQIKIPSFSLPFLTLPQGWHRAIGAFVLVSFAFVLPLHAMNLMQEIRHTQKQVTTFGQEGLSLFETGATHMLGFSVADANQSFFRASTQFTSAKEKIQELGTGTSLILSALPATHASYQTGQHLIQIGESLSLAGLRISEGLETMNQELQPTTTSRLALFSQAVEAALPHIQTAVSELSQVDISRIPESQQATFTLLETRLPVLSSSVEEFLEFSEMLSTILGADGSKRYLLIFQNNTELRPTGGFMGSYAEIKVHNGEIEEMTIPGGGTYDLQGSLQTSFIAPEPLQLLNARWEFQDANWFVDFPTSARTLISFYEDAGGPTVDGVIAINATSVAKLLGLLGPVEMDDYGRTINEENFLFEAQKIVELEYDQEVNQPKAFIGDLAEVLVDRLIQGDANTFLALLTALNQGFSERDVQLYFTQDTLEKQVLDLGWGGAIEQTTGDYLLITDTNLGGGKTDGVIGQQADLTISIDKKGVITNTLTLTRTHFGIPGALFTGVNNVDYVRVYVPKGSTLLSASGFSVPDDSLFEIPSPDWTIHDELYYLEDTYQRDLRSGTDMYEESGKTVFGNWIQTKPGSSSTIQFTYRLPFTLSDALSSDFLSQIKQAIGLSQTIPYTLTIQKQSGVLDRTTDVHFLFPESYSLLWSSHDVDQATFINQTDQFFATLLEHN
ncbi:hypothetical protein A2239_00725 [Candidatus Uhrbacteria bacterium RIFOXYA2_FULL_40_9]|nr:MAG: hypothetical protein UT94_C0006G0018 [Candidatus Uhrbacteria bacterium GW2011_GWF2_40_263]OGL92651.1 MAG: hypothetical protein A2239_00725 [Candidatus Uhrbacteria bacterium RIFOXYA2_FULL_40_9]OGL96703.1 MAG: hypothetical protein A2332_02585 [Candidatus Uhrbacteria bacterium RIFOXYB2_FULL_41_18]HBK34676.1 hypothetical protein [Candidatus Uhrbacteria bacterium]HCB56088.1 hypothetical protein [Candidatus Uhrbacteria bacterium]